MVAAAADVGEADLAERSDEVVEAAAAAVGFEAGEAEEVRVSAPEIESVAANQTSQLRYELRGSSLCHWLLQSLN